MSQSTQPNDRKLRSTSPYQPRLSVMIALVVVFILASFLMLRSSSKSSASAPQVTATSSATTTPGATTSEVVVKAKVSVQVANGTSVSGLARTFTQQLMTLGWDTLPEMNGPKVAATIIYYNPGFRQAGLQIAQTLNVPQTAVVPLNGQQPVSGSSSDDIILILGPDVAVKG